MSRIGKAAGAALAAAMLSAVAFGVPAALAGANSCDYNGQRYEEGSVICQAGVVNVCMNGVWQTKGSFCNGTPDGAPLGGYGYTAGGQPVVIPPPQE
jgi:hypothetical protein